VILDAQRLIVLNGIGGVVTRGDLLDRALLLTLPPITDGDAGARRNFGATSSACIPFSWERSSTRSRPRSRTSAQSGSTRRHGWPTSRGSWSPPRRHFPGSPARFLAAYNGNRDAAVGLGLEASLIRRADQEHRKAGFSRDGVQLLARLEEEAPDLAGRRQGFPEAAEHALRPSGPDPRNLRKLGYVVEKGAGPGATEVDAGTGSMGTRSRSRGNEMRLMPPGRRSLKRIAERAPNSCSRGWNGNGRRRPARCT
ncbi:MAG: hypothetical protein M5T61_21645, partial [Acidimicrobiia bacterium]|nr:hypothetical protein [Acidimicrobiia bacterium]